jgi:hypothetical protein
MLSRQFSCEQKHTIIKSIRYIHKNKSQGIDTHKERKKRKMKRKITQKNCTRKATGIEPIDGNGEYIYREIYSVVYSQMGTT